MTVSDGLWEYAPACPALTRYEIHVWRIILDAPGAHPGQWIQLLSPDERRTAERFCLERDQKRFILCRGRLRLILGHYLGIDPGRVQFGHEPHGKPALSKRLARGGLQFSLSHSHGLALIAVARDRKIGVDVERVRAIACLDQIAGRILSTREYVLFRSLRAPERQASFFRYWTSTEARAKASGDGLVRTIDRAAVSLGSREAGRLVRDSGDTRQASGWFVCELKPGAGYVAALAAEGHDWRLSCWQAPDTDAIQNGPRLADERRRLEERSIEDLLA